MSQVKKEYDQLLESGDLKLLFPRATEIWEEDKKEFTQIHEDNQKMLNDFEVRFKAPKGE